jgi:hypothetical protein
MATNNKPASAYAGRYKEGLKSARKSENDLANVDMSVGNIDKSKGEYPVKKTGIKIRGTGAATKGVMARGPMA